MSKLNTNYILAKYYGFPICCVDAYQSGVHKNDNIKRKLSGTGYIPCLICNSKTQEELISTINKNRISPDIFPDCVFETTVYTILNSNEFSLNEKYLIFNQFLYYLKVTKDNHVSEKVIIIIKRIFRTIDNILIRNNIR